MRLSDYADEARAAGGEEAAMSETRAYKASDGGGLCKGHVLERREVLVVRHDGAEAIHEQFRCIYCGFLAVRETTLGDAP